MGIQNLSEQVILVTLPPEQRIIDELKSANEVFSSRNDCDVVIDFSTVDIITTASINNLIILHHALHKGGHRLILYSVCALTKSIFKVAGLDAVFEFADDKDAAVAVIEQANQLARPPFIQQS